MTVIINASLFMLFDGYVILCDWLDFPCLHVHVQAWQREKRAMRRALGMILFLIEIITFVVLRMIQEIKV